MSKNNLNIIDIHNHSIPFIDDGATSLSMSISMLKLAADFGTTDIILTPHHLNGAFNNFTKDVIENTLKLQNKVTALNIPIKLHFGSEIHLVPETVDHLINNKALTYCGLGKAALIELPKNSIPTGTESILSKLLFNGITPIIAHPERNSALRRDYSQLQEWVDFGCKSQITGQSCTGDFGSSLQSLSFELIAKNLVHFIASDAHRPEGRSPNLKNAQELINKNFGSQTERLLFHTNPSKLLQGLPIKNPKLNTENFQHLFTNARKRIKSKRKGLLNFFS